MKLLNLALMLRIFFFFYNLTEAEFDSDKRD